MSIQVHVIISILIRGGALIIVVHVSGLGSAFFLVGMGVPVKTLGWFPLGFAEDELFT